MTITRRQFGMMLAAASAALPQLRASSHDEIIERRIYDRAGAVPLELLLQRCGIKLMAREEAASDVHLTIVFASLAERTRAWDRFNTHPEWCALRERREVRLREITITAA